MGLKILFVEPNSFTLRDFRKELVDALVEDGHEVHVSCRVVDGDADFFDGCPSVIVHDTDCDLQSKSLSNNLKLSRTYRGLIRSLKPDLILAYTIKPNLYCGRYAKKVPMIANITGLGTAFNKKGLLNLAVVSMYRRSFRNVNHIMFQNQANYEILRGSGVPIHSHSIIPGSGTNLLKFPYVEVPTHEDKRFLFASRFVREKGIDLLLEVLPGIFDEYGAKCHFLFVGRMVEQYRPAIEAMMAKYPESFEYRGRVTNLASLYRDIDFLVSPSFYKEGISNVILESLATGRPVITTNDNPGCMELLLEGRTGYGCKSDDAVSLVSALRKAMEPPIEREAEMGRFGREFVEKNYDRNIVIAEYRRVIASLFESRKQ